MRAVEQMERSSAFRVIAVDLPSPQPAQTIERLPVLIDSVSGVPCLLALRYVARQRRQVVAEKTLVEELRAIGRLYGFARHELSTEFDERMRVDVRLTPSELDRLIDYLREDGRRSPPTVALDVFAICRFLRWAANASDRGSRSALPASELRRYDVRLLERFSEWSKVGREGSRRSPLTTEHDALLATTVGPLRRADGVVRVPLRFSDANPWQPQVRLRNFVAYRAARELGLRRGELGKLRIDDIEGHGGDVVLAVRRRPNDLADTRRAANRPQVKTIERRLPLSTVAAAAVRQYMNTPLMHGGRQGAATPYLLVTATGTPISARSLDSIWSAVNRRMGFDLSWHTLRHTWAEELAERLLDAHAEKPEGDELALAILRELGGWVPGSSTPFRYIQATLQRRGIEFLRKHNERYNANEQAS